VKYKDKMIGLFIEASTGKGVEKELRQESIDTIPAWRVRQEINSGYQDQYNKGVSRREGESRVIREGVDGLKMDSKNTEREGKICSLYRSKSHATNVVTNTF